MQPKITIAHLNLIVGGHANNFLSKEGSLGGEHHVTIQQVYLFKIVTSSTCRVYCRDFFFENTSIRYFLSASKIDTHIPR